MKPNISIKKIEIISLSILIILTIILFFIIHFQTNSNHQSINICVGNTQITNVNSIKIDIDKDLTFIIYKNNNKILTNIINNLETDVIKYENYEYNIIEIKNKRISCIKSNCPNQVCVQHGFLKSEFDNDMILCAPHKLTILYN